MRRIGIFGGTFDPPHFGHLLLAAWARERLRLERVLFVPTGTPPHKARRLTSAARRLAMVRLAVRGEPAFRVSDLETSRHGPSFTLDTLRRVKARHPEARLYLLMGEDSLADFPTWHEPAEIARLATLVVAVRPAPRRRSAAIRHGAFAARGPVRVVRLGNPPLAISSSTLRARARAGL
ncbi:MAG TPA: nicotinate-nucleotide adenylyltransferase, partial [Terriglobales bacterium]|nr:nicotinate-nucleotide adenylyltransferase [Terriglobales bacterium]